jgi:hypothetical protein
MLACIATCIPFGPSARPFGNTNHFRQEEPESEHSTPKTEH